MSSMENMKDIAMDLASNASEVLSHPPNDYYPLGTAIPGYVANEASMAAILTVFFGTCAVLFGSTHFVSKRLQPDLTKTELFTLLWFILSGAIHIFFEGYYVMNVLDIGTHQTWIGQMWKEYAFSDSRYLTQNAFVLCMESITAIAWGPGCLLVAAMVLTRHPLRFPLQGLVSLGQVYGDVLYYGTAYFEHIVYGLSYSRPEPFYFYFYFIFMNAIWMVIPGGKFGENKQSQATQAYEGFRRIFQH
jgi:cholestenol delta-isomerase